MLYVYTFASDESRLQHLKDSAHLFDCQIRCIIKTQWSGYVDKLVYMKEAVTSINDDDIVCFIDGYDVLINANVTTMEEQFKTYHCDLLLGAELNCYPGHYKSAMDNANRGQTVTNYNYINSGGYMGYAKAIKEMLNWKPIAQQIQICSNGGDQSYVTEYYLAHYRSKRIALDRYCKLFQNMHWVNWNSIVVQYGRVFNTVMRSLPCFVHFNGGTHQTQDLINIMPVFLDLMRQSQHATTLYTLQRYKQLQTATCYPHPQHAQDNLI
jgi:hypothetical protein